MDQSSSRGPLDSSSSIHQNGLPPPPPRSGSSPLTPAKAIPNHSSLKMNASMMSSSSLMLSGAAGTSPTAAAAASQALVLRNAATTEPPSLLIHFLQRQEGDDAGGAEAEGGVRVPQRRKVAQHTKKKKTVQSLRDWLDSRGVPLTIATQSTSSVIGGGSGGGGGEGWAWGTDSAAALNGGVGGGAGGGPVGKPTASSNARKASLAFLKGTSLSFAFEPLKLFELSHLTLYKDARWRWKFLQSFVRQRDTVSGYKPPVPPSPYQVIRVRSRHPPTAPLMPTTIRQHLQQRHDDEEQGELGKTGTDGGRQKRIGTSSLPLTSVEEVMAFRAAYDVYLRTEWEPLPVREDPLVVRREAQLRAQSLRRKCELLNVSEDDVQDTLLQYTTMDVSAFPERDRRRIAAERCRSADFLSQTYGLPDEQKEYLEGTDKALRMQRYGRQVREKLFAPTSVAHCDRFLQEGVTGGASRRKGSASVDGVGSASPMPSGCFDLDTTTAARDSSPTSRAGSPSAAAGSSSRCRGGGDGGRAALADVPSVFERMSSPFSWLSSERGEADGSSSSPLIQWSTTTLSTSSNAATSERHRRAGSPAMMTATTASSPSRRPVSSQQYHSYHPQLQATTTTITVDLSFQRLQGLYQLVLLSLDRDLVMQQQQQCFQTASAFGAGRGGGDGGVGFVGRRRSSVMAAGGGAAMDTGSSAAGGGGGRRRSSAFDLARAEFEGKSLAAAILRREKLELLRWSFDDETYTHRTRLDDSTRNLGERLGGGGGGGATHLGQRRGSAAAVSEAVTNTSSAKIRHLGLSSAAADLLRSRQLRQRLSAPLRWMLQQHPVLRRAIEREALGSNRLLAPELFLHVLYKPPPSLEKAAAGGGNHRPMSPPPERNATRSNPNSTTTTSSAPPQPPAPAKRGVVVFRDEVVVENTQNKKNIPTGGNKKSPLPASEGTHPLRSRPASPSPAGNDGLAGGGAPSLQFIVKLQGNALGYSGGGGGNTTNTPAVNKVGSGPSPSKSSAATMTRTSSLLPPPPPRLQRRFDAVLDAFGDESHPNNSATADDGEAGEENEFEAEEGGGGRQRRHQPASSLPLHKHADEVLWRNLWNQQQPPSSQLSSDPAASSSSKPAHETGSGDGVLLDVPAQDRWRMHAPLWLEWYLRRSYGSIGAVQHALHKAVTPLRPRPLLLSFVVTLDLSGNRLPDCPMELLAAMPSLQSLLLHDNAITSLASLALQYAPTSAAAAAAAIGDFGNKGVSGSGDVFRLFQSCFATYTSPAAPPLASSDDSHTTLRKSATSSPSSSLQWWTLNTAALRKVRRRLGSPDEGVVEEGGGGATAAALLRRSAASFSLRQLTLHGNAFPLSVPSLSQSAASQAGGPILASSSSRTTTTSSKVPLAWYRPLLLLLFPSLVHLDFSAITPEEREDSERSLRQDKTFVFC
jgi:hypothetical protein